jgi:hypothetical protein
MRYTSLDSSANEIRLLRLLSPQASAQNQEDNCQRPAVDIVACELAYYSLNERLEPPQGNPPAELNWRGPNTSGAGADLAKDDVGQQDILSRGKIRWGDYCA